MSARRKPFLLFLLLLVLFPAIATVAQAVTDGLAGLALWQWLLLAAFPASAWIYIRHFSRLSCRDECQPQKPC